MKYYSQSGQDKYLYENIFKDKKNGVFVEFGATDGISFSNSYFFEKELGWHGLCIEPILEKYNKLVENRLCKCVYGMVSSDNQICKDFIYYPKAPNLSVAYDYLTKKHAVRVSKSTDKSDIRIVPNYILNNLLDKFKLYKIDYLSIDTEGGELDILKSIDLDKYDIKVIGIEDNYNNNPYDKYFKEKYKNYKYLAKLGADVFYIKGNR